MERTEIAKALNEHVKEIEKVMLDNGLTKITITVGPEVGGEPIFDVQYERDNRKT